MKEIRHTPIYKPSFLLTFLVVFFSPFIFIAQIIKTSFLSEAIEVNSNNNSLVIEAINTNFIFHPSSSNKLTIEAYHQGKNAQATQEWDLKLQEEASYTRLLSAIRPKQNVTSQVYISGDVSNEQLAKMLKHSLAPILQNLQNNPIPKVLESELNELNFDFKAYERIGEAYLRIWKQAFVDRLDDKDSAQIKQWSAQTLPNLIRVSKQGSSTTQNVSTQSSETNNSNNNYQLFFSQSITTSNVPSTDEKYTIEIGVPKGLQIRLNTRHGSFLSKKFIDNIKGKLKYTTFEAERIGGDTDISIEFAPIKINYWEEGKLNIAYSKSAFIHAVNQLNLTLNSSKMKIDKFKDAGVINAAFSKLQISEAFNDFSQLTFLLTQSDLILTLPSTSYNFAYTGNLSLIEYPSEKLNATSLGDIQSHMLNGYSISRDTNKTIQINSKYSQVFLK